jgi:hypothetical protein
MKQPKIIDESTMIKEAFHSFEMKDEFTGQLLGEVATDNKTQISPKEMLKKARSFVQGQRKMGLITTVHGKKWKEKVNGIPTNRQVYMKVGELSNYKKCKVKKIPDQYIAFAYYWNEQPFKTSFTAQEFHDELDVELIPVTYTGQVGKFLWFIKDRGFCRCKKFQNKDTNIYTKTNSIPSSMLRARGAKFYNRRIGPYVSVLD